MKPERCGLPGEAMEGVGRGVRESAEIVDIDPALRAADPTHVCRHVRRGAACAIRPFSICNALRDDDAAALEKLATPTRFAPRHTFLAQGETAFAFYMIAEGVACASRILGDGRRQVVNFLLPGDFIDLSIPVRATCTVEALTPVLACQFGRAQFVRLSAAHPALMRRLHLMLARQMTIAQEQMALLGRMSVEERLAAFLVSLRQRLARSAGLSDFVPLAMSRQDIADYLGLTIETVSRTFTRFDRDGILDVSRTSIRILDWRRLRALAASGA